MLVRLAGSVLAGAVAAAMATASVARASHPAEEGMASWYGAEFHGRPTASGEPFDKEKLTAAHRTLPLGTLVKVINQDNGSEAIVRVNDRGPFAKGRILDCSERAARDLGFWAAGTARVRVEVLGRPGEDGRPLGKKDRKRLERELERARRQGRADLPEGLLTPVDDEAGPFEIQVGAFRDRTNAERLAERLRGEGHGTRLVATPEGLTRVRLGPYPTRREAERAALRVSVEETPFVVRRD